MFNAVCLIIIVLCQIVGNGRLWLVLSLGERDGEERGGPRGGGGGGGRGAKEREGESRDSGGQRRQRGGGGGGGGNAWSKGRPRILSNEGPSQMKKFEEPQAPVSSVIECVNKALS